MPQAPVFLGVWTTMTSSTSSPGIVREIAFPGLKSFEKPVRESRRIECTELGEIKIEEDRECVP